MDDRRERNTGRSGRESGSKRKIFRRTVFLMLVCGVGLFIPLIGQLWNIAIVHHEEYQAEAVEQQTRDVEVAAFRGSIYDSSGDVLAMSATVYNLILSPRDLEASVDESKYKDEEGNADLTAYQAALQAKKDLVLDGVLAVRPVDQDAEELEMPNVSLEATKHKDEDFVRVALTTDGVVPIHQSEGAGKGAWVGVAFAAPEGYEGGTFHYYFGTEANPSASQSTAVTEDPAIGEGKYAVFFINASSIAPKTHITLQWDGQEAVQYVVDLSGVQTPVVELSGVTVSTHELPDGVSSTAEGLSFDGSTALVQNGGSGSLSQEQVAGMGGGGEYTVYYSVPQTLGDGVLSFDKIARSINGGKLNTWAISSETEAESGGGWWTKDGENYYFKWGAVFAEQAEGTYVMKDGGVYEYTLYFIDNDGTQDNVVATYTFQIDLSGYTITTDDGLEQESDLK